MLSLCGVSRPVSDLAERIEAYLVDDSNLTMALADADIVITALGGRAQVLTADMVRLAACEPLMQQ